eukprot:TRINITY_DN834_c0_g1_i1.p2 TRINITY_DN834_c0_g1~~TRINITY_DN834_c0_g1_i1.p2  ORF type:complete len:364 (+),score=89.87 TRINITY_DN834_c0_g1_i1:66-1157(+)
MGWRPSAPLVAIVAFAVGCLVTAVLFMFSPARHSVEDHQHAIQESSARRHLRATARVDGPAAVPRKPAVEVPNKPRRGPTSQWNGWTDIPADEDWDFFGLKVPPTNARDRIQPGDVRADYDLNHTFDPTRRPAGYEYGDNPAFRYPDAFERLYVVVSLKPFALYFPRIATDEEVDAIVREAEPKLVRSQVAVTNQGKSRRESATQEVRTSKSTWVSRLGNLEKRAVNVTGNQWHEPMNVLLYGENQHYDSHHDYFDPSMYGKQTTNRMATLFVWLADTEEGGWTTLPRANGRPMPRNYKQAACQQGLQCKPLKGAGILFYGMRPDRSLDPYSLHGGCDVVRGKKWAGALWFRANTPAGGRAHE